MAPKKKKIKILTGIETGLVSWVAGGGALPAFIIQLTSKEGEKPRFALYYTYNIKYNPAFPLLLLSALLDQL